MLSGWPLSRAPRAAAEAAGRRVGGVAFALLVAAVAAAVSAAQGGYFPTSWGWTATGLSATVVLWAAVARTHELGRLDIGVLASFALLAIWIGISALWSEDPAQSVLELERALVPLTGLAAFLLIARRNMLWLMATALASGMTLVAGIALFSRLFPDRAEPFDATDIYRLAGPVGYWNGLGILCAVAFLLQLGIATHAPRIAARIIASISLVILLVTLYFTFSRGAWVALGIGMTAAVLASPRKLRSATWLLLLAPGPAAAVAIAANSAALTHRTAGLREAFMQGHRVAVWVALLCAAQGALLLAADFADSRLQVRPGLRKAYAGLLLIAVVFGLLAISARFGSPTQLAQRGYRAFAEPPIQPTDLNRRLLNLSGNGRVDMWSVAWNMHTSHPWLGAGAGTFERFWDRGGSLDNRGPVRDAHGLYIETLAELGPLGLAILTTALSLPLYAFARRRNPMLSSAFGGYTAFLVQAGADWTWELSGITLCALVCGSILLLGARRQESERPVTSRLRLSTLAPAASVAVIAFIGLIGNAALAESGAATEAGNLPRAREAALRAHVWAPWSNRPWVALAEAQLQQGETTPAKVSLRRAISMDSRYWRAWYDLALILTGREQRAAAEQAWDLNRLDPDVVLLKERADGAGAPRGP